MLRSCKAIETQVRLAEIQSTVTSQCSAPNPKEVGLGTVNTTKGHSHKPVTCQTHRTRMQQDLVIHPAVQFQSPIHHPRYQD